MKKGMGIEVEIKDRCEFCNDVLQFSEFDKGSSIFMNNGELIVEDCDGNEVAMLEINYCPMCGKRLADDEG